MMNTIIEKFVSDKNIALIGVSSDKKKFGNMLLLELTKKGYTVFPVHPIIRSKFPRMTSYESFLTLDFEASKSNVSVLNNSFISE